MIALFQACISRDALSPDGACSLKTSARFGNPRDGDGAVFHLVSTAASGEVQDVNNARVDMQDLMTFGKK